jgi:RHS repeat-associated protein
VGAKEGVSAAQIDGGYANATTWVKEIVYALDKGNSRSSVTTTLSGQTATTATYTTETDSPRYATVTGYDDPAYDGEGNLLYDGTFWMKYDFKNRLSEVWAYAPLASSSSGGGASTVSPKDLRSAEKVVRERAKGKLLDFARKNPRRLSAPVRSSGGSCNSEELADDLVLVALYSYDTFNRRLIRYVVDTGEDQRSAYDGWREVEELEPDATGTTAVATRAFVWGNDIDAMLGYYQKEGATWVDYYPVQNSKGSVIALYDSAGTKLETAEYDAYGVATVYVGGQPQATSSKGNPYLFQGRRLDPETGFYYFRNRYLHTGFGRFLTNDPIGSWGDAANMGNGLAFVGNNPTTGSDPSGLLAGGFGPSSYASGGGAMALPPGIMTSMGASGGAGGTPGLGGAIPRGPLDCGCDLDAQLTWQREFEARVLELIRARQAELDRSRLRRPTCMDCHGNPERLRNSLPGAMIHGTRATADMYRNLAIGSAVLTGALALQVGLSAHVTAHAGAHAVGHSAAPTAAKGLGAKAGATARNPCAAKAGRTVIGRTKDLKGLPAGERSLLGRLPNRGSPRANWNQNWGVLRKEMSRGLPIRDASPGDTGGSFLNAERALMRDRGWTFDSSSNLWRPPR